MGKVVGSKLRTLLIMQALLDKSDEKHRISVADINSILEEYELKADRKSVYSDIETLKEWGLDIEHTKEKPSGWYLASREFEIPELKLLVDAVQSSKFITRNKSQELIKKLEKMTSVYLAKELNHNVYVSNRVKTDNEQIFYNINNIHEAINKNVQIEFTYYKWTVNKELVPKKQKPYIISPWVLTWDDENYYLIGYDSSEAKVKHYRVDKMKNINLKRKERDGKSDFANFDAAAYAKSTFGMFHGEKMNVTLECDNELIGPILDRFGTNNIVVPVGDDKFQIQQQVNVSRQFYGWIVGLGSQVKIVHPPVVVEEFKSLMQNMLGSYE